METPPPHSEELSRRRGPPLVLLGGLGALVLGGVVAWALVGGDRPSTEPPASEGDLVIDSSGADEAGKIDPGKPLRCFVQGRFVGELSLTDCAERNGVATDALDVGIDETGALAAAEQAGQVLTPLPPQEGYGTETEEFGAAEEEVHAPPTAAISASACWRHGGGRWRKLADTDLNACVQTLFAGRCERPGAAVYGRYGSQTLRLVTGRVEVSDDNRTFRTLTPQAPDCSIPPVGRP